MTYQRRGEREPEPPTRGTRFFSLVYFIIVVAAAYYLSGLVMKEADLADQVDFTIPVLKEPLPPWVLQAALGLFIFFILQFLFVFVVGLLKGEKEDPYRDQWR